MKKAKRNENRQSLKIINESLLELLELGMPTPIIAAYFQVSKPGLTNRVKKLKASGQWTKEPIFFINSIKQVLEVNLLMRQRQLTLEQIDPLRLIEAIEQALEFSKIIEYLKIAISAIHKLVRTEFAESAPQEYRNFVLAVFEERYKISELRDGEEYYLFWRYLATNNDIPIGGTKETWFLPLLDDIISEYARSQRFLVKPIFDHSLIEKVDYLLSTLTTREAESLKRYFGIAGLSKKSLTQMAEEFDLTFERMRQIKEKALRRCRQDSRLELLFKAVPVPNPLVLPSDYRPIEALKLPIRVINTLKRADVISIEQLARLGEDDLRKFEGMGGRSVLEIGEALKEFDS